MNIFRILSSHDGSINEPNVSSFLAYLLNPNEDHGISSLLLQEILNELINVDTNFLSKIQYKNRITDLSQYSGYSINVMPELTVSLNQEGKKKRRDIDILIEIVDDRSKEIIYAICIENKITDASINKTDTQLQDELNGLKALYAESALNPEIYMIYLTPQPSDIASQSFEKLEYEKKYHLYWANHENAVFNKLIKIFNDENQGLIDPINDQVSYLIKSFLSFIKTNFKSYIEERREFLEKKNYGKPVIDLLNDFAAKLEEDKSYAIAKLKKQFSDYVLNESGIQLHNATRNAHFTIATVNDRNRGHYSVKRPDDERKNIFYYPDESRKNVKKFRQGIDKNIPIFFKNDDEIDSTLS
ncbi:PD-(D/E)XK nuclease family protein [Namhaeicola litoreus]|uniref:PD-(D/E)XK nuclease family protein n=1 Tax=Namhaeicola litoreus TaxID=1052145 RepID=A0ABW3Y3Z5_9FLAO